MIALQKIEPAFGLQYREVAEPSSPGPGEVIVAVGATGAEVMIVGKDDPTRLASLTRMGFADLVDFLGTNIEHAREIISHRLPLAQAVEGLELSRTKSASKVLVVQ